MEKCEHSVGLNAEDADTAKSEARVVDNDFKTTASIDEETREKSCSAPEIQEEEIVKEKSECKPQKERKAGYAAIKSEYLLHDYKPTLRSEYLSEQVKKTFGDALSRDDSKKEETGPGKRPLAEDDDSDGNEGEEPSSKKAKLKGRNKHRPQNERIHERDKLCPAIKAGKECSYGESCKFTHDKKNFIERKLPDLTQICPIFKCFGYCRSGITCRYASSHLSEHLDNIVNEELYEQMKSSLLCYNVLSDDVKHKLWKRRFDFKKAMKAVKMAQSTTNPSNCKIVERVSHSNSESKCDTADKPVQSLDVLKGNFEKGTASAGMEIQDSESPTKIDAKPEISHTANQGEDSKDCSSEVFKETIAAVHSMDSVQILGDITDEEVIRVRPEEKKKIDFRNKLYLAPLTTVGNLPFRRVCKDLGVDITCGEMALASQLLKGKASEWSLVKRHPCEDLFGVQVCGAFPDMMAKCAQVLTETMKLDFIDINCGCPIDLVFKKGAGSALMGKLTRLEHISRSMIGVMDGMPLTVKIRTGVYDHKSVGHTLIPRLRDAGVSLVTLHGRSREQRYTKMADWEYISKCATAGDPMPVFGNGDILSYEDANLHMQSSGVSGVMIARGALIKPWIFTEIKEQRNWDISSSERFDILKSYTNYGLEHWGSDQQGLENTRRFLLEWLSFLYRYIPVGVLEQVPQRINERPPYYVGRNDLETLMASANCADWVKLSEMLLGPVPPSFKFLPKHKANAYQ